MQRLIAGVDRPCCPAHQPIALSNISEPAKEPDMIGMNLRCPITGITGTVEAQVVQPDGKALARIADHWLDVENLRGA